MILTDFCKTLGISGKAEIDLAPFWQEILDSFPGEPEFLEDDFLEKWYPRIGNDPDFLPELLKVVQTARNTPVLKLYAWILYYGLNRNEMLPCVKSLPPPEKILGRDAGLLVLAAAIGSFPNIDKTHRKLGLPAHYTDDIFDWLTGACQIHRAGHDGVPGLCINQYYWIRFYIEGKLFRIGRFEYLVHRVRDFLPAIFRSRITGKLAVLSPDDWFYDEAGELAGEGTATKLIFADNTVTGTPITPEGKALLGQTQTLSLDEYEPAVTPWEWVPSIHIPGGGGMTPDKALDSMRQAKVFFKQYFNQDIRMFCCTSWILNPDWETEMPDSNIARFIRTGWAVPGLPWAFAGLFFVFGRDDVDWENVPRSCSLYRAFCNLRERGRMLRSGSIFFMTEDLDDLCENYYRKKGR